MPKVTVKRWSVLMWLVTLGGGASTFGQAPPEQIRYLEGHTQAVYAVRAAADGKTAASASIDGTVNVWDLTSGQLIRSIPAHAGPALSLAISRDSKQLATGGLDRKVHLFELPTGTSPPGLAGVPGVPLAMDVSPNGNQVLTVDQGKTLRLWDVTTNAAVRDFGGITGEPVAVAMVPATKLILAASQEGSVRSWQLDTAQPSGLVSTAPISSMAFRARDQLVAVGGTDGLVRFLRWPVVAPVSIPGHGDQVNAVAIASHGKFILSGSNDQIVQIVTLADNKLARALAGQVGPVTSVALDETAILAAAGSATGTIKFWQTADGADRFTLAGHVGAVSSLAFQPKSTTIASAGADGTLRLWNAPTATITLASHAGVVQAVAASADGKVFATASADKSVKLWSPTDGKLVRTQAPQLQPVQRVALGPDGQQFATGDALGAIRVFAAKDGVEQGLLEGHTLPVTGLAFRAGAKQLVSTADDGTVRIWNLPLIPSKTWPFAAATAPKVVLSANRLFVAGGTDGAAVGLDPETGAEAQKYAAAAAPLTGLALTTDGALLAGATNLGGVKFWNAADGVDRGSLAGHEGAVAAIAVHPSLPQVATGGLDGTVRLWRHPIAPQSFTHHAKPIKAVAVGADGKLMVSTAEDMTVQLWTLPDGKPTVTVPTQTAVVHTVAVRPDGKQVVTGDATGMIRVWNSADGAPLASWGAHDAAVTSLAFDTAGQQFVSSGADGGVALWKLPTVALRTLHERPVAVAAMATTTDGKLLAVASADKSLTIVDVATGKANHAKEALPNQSTALSFAVDGSLLAVGNDSGSVQFYKAADGADAGADAGALGGHVGAVAGVAFHPKGGQLATAGADGTLRLWNAPLPSRPLSGAGKKINVLAASPNGQLIATATEDGVQLWTAADGKVARPLAGHKGAVTALAWKADSTQLATAGVDGTVRVWNAADGRQITIYEAHKTPVSAVSFTTDGAAVVSAGTDKLAQIWSATDAKPLQTLTGHTQPVTALASVFGGAFVVSGSTDATVRTWNATDGKPGTTINAGAPVTSLAVSGDGKLLVVGCQDKLVKVFQLADGKLVATHTGHAQPVGSVAWNSKNTRIASASNDGALRVWDAVTGQLLETLSPGATILPTSVSFLAPDERTLVVGWSDGQAAIESLRLNWSIPAAVGPAPTGSLTSVAFTPDGASLLTGGTDKKVQLWNALDGKLLRPFAGPTDVVTSIAISADGTKVFAGGVDKAVRVWNFADAALISTLTHPVAVRALRPNSDGSRLATGADDNMVRIWSLPAGRVIERHADATKPVTALAFSADNLAVHFAAADGRVRSVPLAVVFNEPAHAVGATYATISPDGKVVASGGIDKLVKLTDPAGKPIAQLADCTSPVRGIALRGDGAQLAASGDDAQLYFWRLDNRQLEKKLPLGAPVSNLSYSADKLRLVAAGADNRLRIVHVAELRVWEDVIAPAVLRGVAFLPDGVSVVTGGADNKLHLQSLAGTALLSGHVGTVQGLAFTPDGKGLVSAGADKTLRHWNPVDGKLVRALAGHADIVTSVVVTGDGAKIVSASADKTVRTWNVSDGVAGATITLTVPVRGLVATADPTRIAGYADDLLVHVWDLTSGRDLQRFTGHKAAVSGLASSADGKRIFSVSADKTIARWPIAAERLIVADPAKIYDLALIGDGAQFVTSGEDKLVKLWDDQGKLVRQFGGSPTGVRSVAVSADGARVAAGGDPTMAQPTVWVWNLADAKLLQTIATPVGVSQVAYDTDQKLAVGGADKHLRLYSIADGRLLEDFTAPAVLLDVVFAGEKQRLVTAGSDNNGYLFTPSLLRAWSAHVGGVAGVAFTPDGTQLVSAGADKLVSVWNVADGKKVNSYGGHTAAVTSVSLSADGQRIVAGGADKTLQIWERTAPNESQPDAPIAAKSVITHAAGIRSVAFAADGKQIVAGGDDNMVWSWDVATGKEREHWIGHTGPVLSVALSPDGKSLITGSIDRTLRRWTPSVLGVASALEGPVGQVAIAPEENLAFAGGEKGATVAVATDTFQVARKFAGAAGSIKALGVSRDGKFLAAGTDDAKLQVWKCADGTLLASTTVPGPIRSLAVGAEAARIVVACNDKIIRNYALLQSEGKAELQLTQQGHGHTDAVVAVSLTDEDRVMLSVSLDRTIKRWLTASNAAKFTFAKEGGPVYGLDFSANGKLLGIASGDKTARIFKTDTGEQATAGAGHPGQVAAIAFRNAEQFASATSGGTLRVWGLDGQPVHERTDPQLGNLRTLGFSNDGNMLALAGTGRVVQLWDAAKQTLAQTLRGHNATICQAVYNPTGSRLTTLDETGQLFVWDPSSGALLYHQQLPLSVAYSVAYSADGKEWFVAGRDPRVLRVSIPVPAQ
ncbi:MAG: hypothetical protein K8U03_01235 [Planctomycetia bacterium]|nr:hypothetical protein [Planctomycetia bacterium]